jgi:hypothetical protein
VRVVLRPCGAGYASVIVEGCSINRVLDASHESDVVVVQSDGHDGSDVGDHPRLSVGAVAVFAESDNESVDEIVDDFVEFLQVVEDCLVGGVVRVKLSQGLCPGRHLGFAFRREAGVATYAMLV